MDDRGETQFIDVVPTSAEQEAGAASSVYLIVLCGGIPGAMLPLGYGANWIGRAVDNSLQLPENSISRHHALLHKEESGIVSLTDLGSTNGTFLNGQRLAPDVPVTIEDGDRIRVGSSVVVKFVKPDQYEERFQKEMFERTVRDSLTGLYNRSFFLDQEPRLAAKAAIHGLGIAVMMLDVDHFKKINDQYGHSTGDNVLQELADVLRQCTRSEDIVARYGGEEFIIALPVSTPRRALERAEKIRRAVAARRMRFAGDEPAITVSLGVSFASPGRPRTPSSLISAADLHLYQAKESGRNCVVGDVDLERRSPSGELTIDNLPSFSSSSDLTNDDYMPSKKNVGLD